jgi:hypothetical protein
MFDEKQTDALIKTMVRVSETITPVVRELTFGPCDAALSALYFACACAAMSPLDETDQTDEGTRKYLHEGIDVLFTMMLERKKELLI